MSQPFTTPSHPHHALRLPGLLLGIGLGGFVDGIVLHQVLQWHHMLSSLREPGGDLVAYPMNTVAGLEVNTLWDGLFHVATLIAVIAGLALLYRRIARAPEGPWSAGVLCGWILIGWGAFNLVEGIIDHHVLGIHHVRGGLHQLEWDLGFLALGLALALLGAWLMSTAARRLPNPPRRTTARSAS